MSALKDRYPGLRAFERDDQELFFGRNDAVADVTKLIKSEKITILYGNSGTGKSSLLNTKVTSQLEEDKYFPIRVRFTGGLDKTDTDTPVQIIQKELDLVIQLNKESQIIIFDSEKPRLWEYIKIIERSFQRNKIYEYGVVLVFDQFEEFFYFPDNQQSEFTEQLAELVHDWPPKRILDWVNGLNETDITDEILKWHKQPEVRVIFSIRSDKLSLLDSMVKVLPKVLRSRYELRTFNKDNATPAIMEPGLLSNDELKYNSPPINFGSVNDQIIHELKNELGEIEVSFLQVICSYLESFVVIKCKNDKKSTYEISKDDLKELQFDVSIILDKHYQDQTEIFSDADKKLIRKIIEDDLVISGQRASLLKSQLVSKLGGKEYLVTDLLKARLIREETTARGLTYELCHDRLVPTVEKFKATRQEIERTEELKQQDLKTQESLKKQRIQLNKEQRLRQVADERRLEAEHERNKAKELQLQAIKDKEEALDLKAKAEKAERDSEERRKEAENERAKAKELEKQAIEDKEIAVDLKDKAQKAQVEANVQRKKAKMLSYFLMALGIFVIAGSIIYTIDNKGKVKAEALKNAQSKYFRMRGTNAYEKLNLYEGFNYLWAADRLNGFESFDTLLQNNRSTIFRANVYAFSDDEIIQVYLLNNKLQVWQTNRKPFILLKEFANVKLFSLSGNGQTLVLDFEKGETEVWNIKTVKLIGTFQNIKDEFDVFGNPYSMSWNGRRIGYFDSDYNVIICSVMEKLKFDTINVLKTTERKDRSIGLIKSSNQIGFARDGKKIFLLDFTRSTKQPNKSSIYLQYYWLNLDTKIPVQLNESQRMAALEKGKIILAPNNDTVYFLKDRVIKGFDLNSGSETKTNIKVDEAINSKIRVSTKYSPNSGHIMIKNSNSPIAYFYYPSDSSKNFILKDFKKDYFDFPSFEMYKDFIVYLDTTNSLRVYFFKNHQYGRLNIDNSNLFLDESNISKVFAYSEFEKALFYIEKDTLFKAFRKGIEFNFQMVPGKYRASGISAKNRFLILNIDSGDEGYFFQVNSLTDTTIQQIRGVIPHLLKLE